MKPNAVKRLWHEGKPAFGAWLTIPSGFSAEVVAHQGFDWVCIDMQHGLIDYQTMTQMLQAMSGTAVTPFVRVPWNEPGITMKSLDAGAYGVIVPLVNSRSEAEAAVAAMRYPPHGMSSYGPARAAYVAGGGYAQEANDELTCVVMIETKQALDAVDEILSVPGVDACYIGPADLSLSLGLPPPSPDAQAYQDARRRIVEACARHNVVAGTHGSAAQAPQNVADGFRLVLVSSDAIALASTAAAELRTVRAEAGTAAPEA
jgi:4-hydroxy-2-oxoheptanedioate aldolase